MRNEYINTQSPIPTNAGFLFSEPKESHTSRLSWQNTEILLKLGWNTSTVVEIISSPSGEEESESGITQELADTQQKLPAFPFYNGEEILNLDAVVFTPPPLQSGTIRVKLIYEEPSKPLPVENPWEE